MEAAEGDLLLDLDQALDAAEASRRQVGLGPLGAALHVVAHAALGELVLLRLEGLAGVGGEAGGIGGDRQRDPGRDAEKEGRLTHQQCNSGRVADEAV